MAEILLLEDEESVNRGIEFTLKKEGYEVENAGTIREAWELFQKQEPKLMICDVNLPDGSSLDLIRRIRKTSLVHVICLTAMDTEIDQVMGYEAGADDYITKPFNPLEVVARVKAQLRQYMRYRQPQIKQEDECSEYDIRGMTISKKSHKCILFGKELQLTPTEFSILWYLCENQGEVISTEELFEAVWGEKYMDNNNTVMAHIGRLREKMKERAKNPKFIKTVWGVGYTIEK